VSYFAVLLSNGDNLIVLCFGIPKKKDGKKKGSKNFPLIYYEFN